MKSPSRSLFKRAVLGGALAAALLAPAASASPVLLAGAGNEKVNTTDITVMTKDGTSVVSVLADYKGMLEPFAVLMAVPADVTARDVTTIKREFIDRVSHVSAPRFGEFWEMDPCDPEKLEQAWEQDRSVKSAGFLGELKTDPAQRVAKELLMDMEAKKKDGEYSDITVGSAEEILSWLSERKLQLPAGGEANLKSYEGAGYKILALAVDPNAIELTGGSSGVLSPIRFVTREPLKALPVRFGLPSSAGAQELNIFAFDPSQRIQTTNYETKAAPTNLRVAIEAETETRKVYIKERMGELFAALHDRFLEKNPQTFLAEYAFPTDDCGKPCPTEPLLPHEILSLGADVFEEGLPKEVREPEPPEATEEEEGKLEARMEGLNAKQKKELRKDWEAERATLLARKELIKRNRFILSRLHYRYTKDTLPKDVELGPGAAIEGGIALPEGEKGAADSMAKPADENRFQTRVNGLHPNIKVVKCDSPQPYRWGKAPKSDRSLNKIWVAQDLARKKRKVLDPEKVVLTPYAPLGLQGEVEEKPPEPPKKEEGCGCHAAGSVHSHGETWAGLAALLAGLVFWRRRQRSRS